ncbi:MAG: hypothetical protein WC661_02210 [Opitutaceae bacterium]
MITITLLAFLVLLLVSLATLTRVETQVAANSQTLSQARQNALLGLNIAMGQLQRYAGPDQRVTFPATTLYPSKDVTKGTGEIYDGGPDLGANNGYRKLAVTANARSYLANATTYLTPAERTGWDAAIKTYWNANNRSPRYTGVFDSSLRVDRASNPNGAPAALARQQYETNPATTFGEFKRDQVPVWLVSGVEKYQIDQAAGTVKDAAGADKLTEYTTTYGPTGNIPDPATGNDSVWLVNTKSATLAADSVDGLDGRVKVKMQPLSATPQGLAAAQTVGHYAYWVGDESTKANFAIHDPYTAAAVGSVEYRNRLQVPQRLGWERMTGFTSSTLDPNSADFQKVLSPGQIAFLDATLADSPGTRGPVPRNFHNTTAYSRSLLTDTALGGLKKDLTVYLQSGTGLTGTDPIANPALYASSDPRFKAWSATNAGFPATTANIPTWGQLRAWYGNAASSGGALTPSGDTAPVLTYLMFHAGWSYDGASQRIRWHWLPCIVLWNPYDTDLASATYDLEISFGAALWQVYVVKDNPSLSELQKDADAGWTGNPGIKSTWQYTDSTNTARSVNLADPNSVNIDSGPWTKDANLNDGTSDCFGRYWYRLTAAQPSETYFGYQGTGGSGNPDGISVLGPKTFSVLLNPHSKANANPVVITRPFKFKITSGFSPGQVKVFTVASTQQWNPPAPITLSNQFDTASPSSLWFDILNVANGPAAANSDLKFYFEQLANSNVSPGINFSVGGQPIMTSTGLRGLTYGRIIDNFLGTSFSALNSGSLDSDGDGRTNNLESAPKFVNTWRQLYDFDQFDSPANMLTTATNNRLSSIWPYGATWVQPLTSDGLSDPTQLNQYISVFSRFNAFAKITDSHPFVDAKRDQNYVNNTDGMIHLLTNRADTAFTKWDNGQANGTDGYALITFKNIDTLYGGSTIAGQATLPIRNARRANSEVLSLGQFQQANLSPFIWNPAFPIGNSFAAPYTDREAIAGLNSRSIGGSIIAIPAAGHPSGAIGKVPGDSQNRTLDLSYLLNENLWDRTFLSTIPQSGAFDATANLANSRLKFSGSSAPTAAQIRDFDTASAYLSNVGALNVNSTSVEAWKALLSAFRGLSIGATPDTPNVPVARTLDPVQGSIQFTNATQTAADIGATANNKDYRKILAGFRYLTDAMIQTLAERIVDEVRLRGPFLSLSDFVNRRLIAPAGSGIPGSDWHEARTNGLIQPTGSNDLHSDWMNPSYDPFIGLQGLSGALERALQVSGINGGVNYPSASPSANDRVYGISIRNAGTNDGFRPDTTSFTNAGGAIANNSSAHHSQDPALRCHLDSEHIAGAPVGEAGQLFDGAPGFVTQGDLLGMLGPALTPRGDTFLVRTYGDSLNPATGEIQSRAWLEAVVQRTVEPVTPAATTGPDQFRPSDAFGRKFKIVSFRWLSATDL